MAKVDCTYCKAENIVSDAVILGNLGDIKVRCLNCGKTFIIPGAPGHNSNKSKTSNSTIIFIVVAIIALILYFLFRQV